MTTNRELFHATMRLENGDQLLHMEQGFYVDMNRWRDEGLPPHVRAPEMYGVSSDAPDLFDFLNISKIAWVGFNQFYIPGFPEELLEENPRFRRVRNTFGNVLEFRNDGGGSPPHEVEFAIHSLRDYEERRERLTGPPEQRYDAAALERDAPLLREQQDHIVALWVHGPFAYLREFLGTEGAMMAMFTEPDLVRRMLDDHLDLSRRVAEPIIRATRPDFSFVWEDCCGSTGPFVSPAGFAEFCAPWYRAWKDFLVHNGVPWIMLDTDGRPDPLARQWHEAGVDCVQPWEVNSSDILQVARELPTLKLMGGVYKHVFEPDHFAQRGRFATRDVHALIDEELNRVVAPLRKRGGYIPGLDHWVHPGVGYRDYRYFCRRLEESFGKANRSTRGIAGPPTA